MSKEDFLPLEITHLVRDSCLCMHLQRAARAMARHFDDALRPHGLTSGQFSLLMSLNRPDAPSIGSVAQLLAMDRTTLTANIKPLERRGLMKVSPHPKDKRSRCLSLTDEGRRLLKEAFPTWQSAHERAEDLIGTPDAERLRCNLVQLS
ncbi:MarR family winged helix-turn-helix transcriptional regulator [Kordiimonas aestuarii]|uniref:MarR family winged helix-turn-helix transcriptional regulator n=1 Tax=Kordiimonas aestuarii TaxID=1005925 RepID=UPI0021D1E493|nr:MarR family transcriptional regulator [Kordiimonas aestuarii]